MAIIAYLDSFAAPNAEQILHNHNVHHLRQIDSSAPLQVSYELLREAHAYQCIGARDEIPPGLLVDADFLKEAPNMLVVSSSGSGTDVFDRQACNDAGVLIVNQAGANADAVAETAVMMMIAVGKNLARANHLLRGGWTGTRRSLFGHDLSGRTVGIVGLGNIGRRVAEICSFAFRCRCLAYDPYLTEEEIASRQATSVGFEELLEQSDYVTVHTPLTEETRYMFDGAAFAAMKPGAVFISCARGFIHDENALAQALESGHLAGAGLDVWEIEPPKPDHPLMKFDNVLVSPHIAGGTFSAVENMAAYAAYQFIEIFDGNPAPRPINPEVLPKFEERFQAILG
ncbi:MAG: hydroxyacid dehydrogenase [Pseudomonadota bacterium]